MTVVFVPSAPLLLLDAGPPELRTALASALARLPGEVVVVGAAPTPGWWTGSVDLTPYGVRGTPTADPLPLALAVGAHLVPGARLWGAPSGPLPESPSYLVVGDGTAKRTLKAPGHLDERAAGFDAALVEALAAGDPAALEALDPDLAEQLWVQGMPALRSLAGLGGRWQAEVTYADAPYGVGYAVAVWRR